MEVEPFWGRLSPQAKSRAKPRELRRDPDAPISYHAARDMPSRAAAQIKRLLVHAIRAADGTDEPARLGGADYIIYGIPFTTMPIELPEKIMLESREALLPGGAATSARSTRALSR